ncbi:MAG: putative membrane protein [Bacteroidia bacterium]|jgi:putative membrane protein
MTKHVIIFLKGLAMGAADVVPGVSGGTIAFITGIYNDLLAAINAFNINTFNVLRKQGVRAAWKEVNGSFLLALGSGIVVSALSLAIVFKKLMATSPHFLWAFFFGLVLGSIVLVGKMIIKFDAKIITALVIGTAVSFALTVLEPGSGTASPLYIFIAGAIAICAMILPGISGAFILLLLGVYPLLLDAVHDRDFKFIGILGAGFVVGLLSFSRFLKWLLDNYFQVTLAVLLGFLVGSLNKIWPWKSPFIVEGHEIQHNILPSTHEHPQIAAILGLVVLGFVVIVLLSKFAPKIDETK